MNNITKMDKETFVGAFKDWYEQYKDIVNEPVHNKRGKRKLPIYVTHAEITKVIKGTGSNQTSY